MENCTPTRKWTDLNRLCYFEHYFIEKLAEDRLLSGYGGGLN